MKEGVVKALRLDRGFGFIVAPNEPDLFFHASDVDETLPFDEQLIERRVRFNIVGSPKGPRAVAVRPAD
jgi:cold shock CspA family protein